LALGQTINTSPTPPRTNLCRLSSRKTIMTTACTTTVKVARSSQTSWLRRTARALAELASALSHRYLTKGLQDLSDYELADIGLTRSELDQAFDLPLGVDPSRYLNDLARSSSMRTIRVSSGTIYACDYPPPNGRVE
jgi:uncharacterized protein YjiS (DUF1127 family)